MPCVRPSCGGIYRPDPDGGLICVLCGRAAPSPVVTPCRARRCTVCPPPLWLRAERLSPQLPIVGIGRCSSPPTAWTPAEARICAGLRGTRGGGRFPQSPGPVIAPRVTASLAGLANRAGMLPHLPLIAFTPRIAARPHCVD